MKESVPKAGRIVYKSLYLGDSVIWEWLMYVMERNIDSNTELMCISRTDGSHRQASLSDHKYITEILDEHVVPYEGFVGDGFTLMHKNHTALIVRNYTELFRIPVVQWPEV